MTSEDLAPLAREGRVWCFGDDINTDLIFPVSAMDLPLAEQHTLVFSANRPGWVDLVEPGDLLVAGRNFGSGSGRPVGRLLGALGIAAIAADSLNGLGFRNCVSFAMPAINCPGVTSLLREGQRARIDFRAGSVVNLDTGEQRAGTPLPELLIDIIAAGGVLASLRRAGAITDPPPPARRREVPVTLRRSGS